MQEDIFMQARIVLTDQVLYQLDQEDQGGEDPYHFSTSFCHLKYALEIIIEMSIFLFSKSIFRVCRHIWLTHSHSLAHRLQDGQAANGDAAVPSFSKGLCTFISAVQKPFFFKKNSDLHYIKNLKIIFVTFKSLYWGSFLKILDQNLKFDIVASMDNGAWNNSWEEGPKVTIVIVPNNIDPGGGSSSFFNFLDQGSLDTQGKP
ncbi:hypothetical protein ACJX0J_014642 [Zea mays]